MPKVGELIQSKYLKRSDVLAPVLATITRIDQVDVSMENKPPEMKYAMSFQQFNKPMILNVTNIQALMEAFNSTDDTDLTDWQGRQIVVYDDPSIMFGGKKVGGVRLRAPKTQGNAPAKKTENPAPQFDDDIPF